MGRYSKIYKEFCPGKDGRGTIVLRRDNYDHSLGHIETLFAVARRDFPGLKPSRRDVRIQCYGGDRRKGQIGIEIDVPANLVPEEYVRIENLESTL